MNICPVVYQALHTAAVLFQSGDRAPSEHSYPPPHPLGVNLMGILTPNRMTVS